MYEFSRVTSGVPVPQSSVFKPDSGTPGFDRLGNFKGYRFFKDSSWSILNKTDGSGWVIEAHWAFSLGKRAKGFPTQKKRINSLLKFKSRTLVKSDPPDQKLTAALEFGREYVMRFPAKKVRANMDIHISDSTSACWERSRQRGGRHKQHYDRIRKFRELGFCFEDGVESVFCPSGKPLDIDPVFYKEFDGVYYLQGSVLCQVWPNSRLLLELAFSDCLSDPDIPMGCETEIYSESSYEDLSFYFYKERPKYVALSYPESLPSRMDSVDDDGGKARVIGITKSHLIDLEHVYRTCFTAVLKCDRTIPTLGWGGKDPTRTLGPDPPFDSADLTAATDNSSIPEVRNLALGSVLGMKELGVIPEWLGDNLETIIKVSMRPTRAHAPPWWRKRGPLADTFPFTTERSVPMGQSHSWVLLCLGQKFHRHYGSRGKTKFYRETICGDDSSASGGTLESYLAFRESLVESGYEISKGTDIISNLCVQYTENLYVRMVTPEGRAYLRKVKYPPVKSLLSKVPPTRAPQIRGTREKSFNSSRGSAAASATAWVSLPLSEAGYAEKVQKASRILSLYANARMVVRSKELDIPTYLPREFGGMGFIHPDTNNLSHTGSFFLKGLSSLLSDNRNINYILNFRTLGSIWTYSAKDPSAEETKRLYDSWVGSVFTSKRKITHEADLNRSMDASIWERPSWIDVDQFYEYTFGVRIEKGDWESYDKLKDHLKEVTGLPWYPIKEVLDHVETHFRMDVLFSFDPVPAADQVPSLGSVSQKIHRFYRDLLAKQPPPPTWRELRGKSISDLIDTLHWRQNLVLVAGYLPLLEKFKSRW